MYFDILIVTNTDYLTMDTTYTSMIDADYSVDVTPLKDFSIIPNFLSSIECNNFINLLEESPDVERLDTRNRLMFHSEELAEILWNRLVPYFDKKVVIDEFGDEWTAYGTNDRFRLVKYDTNDEFALHEDGFFYNNYDERSFATFMMYLNDVDEENGGATTFVDHSIKLQPKEGLCLAFLVDRLFHKGDPITSGEKYILRTDVMYRCTKMKNKEMRKKMYDVFNELNYVECNVCSKSKGCDYHDKLGWQWFEIENEYRNM